MKKCYGVIKFGDDFGDNTTTFHCDLPEGHVGKHIERGDMFGQVYKLQWEDKPKTLDEANKQK